MSKGRVQGEYRFWVKEWSKLNFELKNYQKSSSRWVLSLSKEIAKTNFWIEKWLKQSSRWISSSSEEMIKRWVRESIDYIDHDVLSGKPIDFGFSLNDDSFFEIDLGQHWSIYTYNIDPFQINFDFYYPTFKMEFTTGFINWKFVFKKRLWKLQFFSL